MLSAVTIPELVTTFFVEDLAEAPLPVVEGRDHWRIEDDVRVDVPADLYGWPEDEVPEPILLCRSAQDPGSYRVFKRSADVPDAKFHRTGMTFGRIWLPSHWGRFVLHLPRLIDGYRVADGAPPVVGEEPLLLGREAG